MKSSGTLESQTGPAPSGGEKPISLWGAPVTDVLGALLKTKPMPKENKGKKENKE